MKRSALALLLMSLMGFSSASNALNEFEAEDLADVTAIFVYLKNNCGYQDIPNDHIRRVLIAFAQQNRWNLNNYSDFDMTSLGEDSYRDLTNIPIPTPKKCQSLAQNSLGLLAYAK